MVLAPLVQQEVLPRVVQDPADSSGVAPSTLKTLIIVRSSKIIGSSQRRGSGPEISGHHRTRVVVVARQVKMCKIRYEETSL